MPGPDVGDFGDSRAIRFGDVELVLKERLASPKQIEDMKASLKDQKYVSPMSVLKSREKRLAVEADDETAVTRASS